MVVLPSTWLTVILRYTGRSSDDYKAFCSFLKLRAHVPPDSIDVYKLVEQLSGKTSSGELKMRIVQEVYENRDKYLLNNDLDYERSASKAFDLVLSKMLNDKKTKINKLELQLEESRIVIDRTLENTQLMEAAKNEKKINILIEDDENKHFRLVRIKKWVYFIAVLIFVLCLIILAVYTLLKKGPVYYLLSIKLNRPDLTDPQTFIGIITIVGSFAGFIITHALKYIRNLDNIDNHKEYRNKRKEYYDLLFKKKDD